MSSTGRILLVLLFVLPVKVLAAGDGNTYRALEGISELRVVFDVSTGSITAAERVFRAVRDVYKAPEVMAMTRSAEVVVVFRGPAVKLLTLDKSQFAQGEGARVSAFQETLRTMSDEGVSSEVCLYAVKMAGLTAENILPEITKVGNGFISIAGYQNQGYAVIAIP